MLEWRALFHFVFQECPSGVVNEDTFKDIYSQFFPQGGLCHSYSERVASELPRVFHSCFVFTKIASPEHFNFPQRKCVWVSVCEREGELLTVSSLCKDSTLGTREKTLGGFDISVQRGERQSSKYNGSQHRKQIKLLALSIFSFLLSWKI